MRKIHSKQSGCILIALSCQHRFKQTHRAGFVVDQKQAIGGDAVSTL
jgi:hypothetical protein